MHETDWYNRKQWAIFPVCNHSIYIYGTLLSIWSLYRSWSDLHSTVLKAVDRYRGGGSGGCSTWMNLYFLPSLSFDLGQKPAPSSKHCPRFLLDFPLNSGQYFSVLLCAIQ